VYGKGRHRRETVDFGVDLVEGVVLCHARVFAISSEGHVVIPVLLQSTLRYEEGTGGVEDASPVPGLPRKDPRLVQLPVVPVRIVTGVDYHVIHTWSDTHVVSVELQGF